MKENEVEAFYFHQNQLFGDLYTRPVGDSDFEKVRLFQKIIKGNSLNVLELGAGGGQHAFALAQSGHSVTAIEIQQEFTEHIKKLAKQLDVGNLRIINDSFYTVTLNDTFDVVTYWDGFGIGTDKEQILLLNRVSEWLKPDGVAIVDVYTPWNALMMNGKQMRFESATREYGYDAENNRWLDTWWNNEKPKEKWTQSLRCYSPADLELLLENTDLQIDSFEFGPYINPENFEYHKKAPSLEKTMWYTVKLIKKK